MATYKFVLVNQHIDPTMGKHHDLYNEFQYWLVQDIRLSDQKMDYTPTMAADYTPTVATDYTPSLAKYKHILFTLLLADLSYFVND